MLKLQTDRYIIKKWLGGGAFSDIYLAVDKFLDEKVALKVPKLKFISKKDVIKEAKLMVKCNHPSIVRFFHLEIIDNVPVIVMEYIAGKTLREKISKKINEIQIINYMQKILEALIYLHKIGILHRDLKPENIFIIDEKIKIGDLGLSNLKKELIEQNLVIKGTLNYMAPEVFNGEYYIQSDIWSCGIIMYELFTGKNPVAELNLQLDNYKKELHKIEFNFSHIPNIYISILRKALNTDYKLRFNSVEEFLDAIKNLLLPSKTRIKIVLKEKDFFSILTESQKRAVLSDKKEILLIGSAGSGKTFTLTAKISYLLREKNIPPENILALTFTNKAAIEMKERIKFYTGKKFFNLTISTFHNFCNLFLRNEAYIAGFDENYKIINESARQKIVYYLAKQISDKYSFIFRYNTSLRLVKEISKFKSNGWLPAQLKINTKRRKFLQELYINYLKYMKQKNRMDFDDLIFYAVRILEENKEIREKYQKRFKYILVDEYQDINEIQFILITLLHNKENYFFAVGDDDQLIYGFRGSNSKYIENFNIFFPDSEIIIIDKNFRSAQKIIKVANNLISYNKKRVVKKIIPAIEKRGTVEFYNFKSNNSEANFIINKITKLVQSGNYIYKDFAILFRMNYQSRIFEEYFQKYGIPYNLISLEPFFSRDEIQKLITLLEFILSKKYNYQILKDIIDFPEKIRLKELKNFLKENEHLDFPALLKKLLKKYKSSKILKQRVKNLNNLYLIKDFENGIEILEQIFKMYRIQEQIETLKKINKLNLYLNLNEFKNIMKNIETENNFSLKNILDNVQLKQSADLINNENRVKLLTIHSAKGLQFKVVFITGLIEGIIPHSLSLSSEKALEEERRLMYVAITRAQEQLYLTSYKLGYTDISRFIYEMNV